MIRVNDKKECCGCNACVQSCPKKCIVMARDEEGFLYPEVDYSQCVECGLCEKACPILNAEKKQDRVLKCYVAYAKDESIRLQSSSGGVFTLLAEAILQKQGIVFGASLDENMQVKHISIDNVADLSLLRGSKYVQSDIGNTYIEVKKNLENGRQVLFSGTACQIAGLKQYLRKDFENLYTIDILCHGVPSPKVWDLYLQWQKEENQSSIKQVQFRQKQYGWKLFSMEIQFEHAKPYVKKFVEDPFMQMFLREICLRPSCHDCKFKALERPSDITLGDCWGVHEHMPEMDDDKGTSIILLHSEKGQALLDLICETVIHKEADVDIALSPTADSRKSVPPHKNREKFFVMLNEGSELKKLVKLVREPLFKRVLKKSKQLIKKLLFFR